MTHPARSAGAPRETLLLWEIQQTARVVTRLLDRAMEDAGLARGDFGVLACVNDEPGITQAEIARQLHVRPQTLTGMVDRLRRTGHLRGAPAGRGRRSSLVITALGRDALDAAWPHVLALNAPGRLGLPPTVVERLATELADLRDTLTSRERAEDRSAPE